MVYKILAFEKTPILIPDWYIKGTTIVREDGQALSDSIYVRDIRMVMNFWTQYGYTKIDTFRKSLGHDSTHVINAVNEGREFVLYRGSGVVNWFRPFKVEPESLSNDSKFPIVVSATCQTIAMWPGAAYAGERWLRAGIDSLKGACAFLGTTTVITGGAGLRSAFVRGFFKKIYLDSVFILGEAFKAGKKQVWDSTWGSIYHEDETKSWQLLGDPSMTIWTKMPKNFQVSHPSLIQAGKVLSVNVKTQGNPVKNATVCIYKENEIYEVKYTDQNGDAEFNIPSSSSFGTLYITVTKYNFLPYEGEAIICDLNPPTNLQATSTYPYNSVILTWKDNSMSDEYYEIWVRKQGEQYFHIFQTISGNGTDTGMMSYTLPCERFTDYYFKVRWKRGTIFSDFSNITWVSTSPSFSITDTTAIAYPNSPKIIESNGKLHLVYSDSGKIKYIFSEDHGITWSSPMVISGNQTNAKYPAIGVTVNGILFCVWTNKDADGKEKLYYNYYQEGWKEPFKIYEGGTYTILLSSCISSDSLVHIAFLDFLNRPPFSYSLCYKSFPANSPSPSSQFDIVKIGRYYPSYPSLMGRPSAPCILYKKGPPGPGIFAPHILFGFQTSGDNPTWEIDEFVKTTRGWITTQLISGLQSISSDISAISSPFGHFFVYQYQHNSPFHTLIGACWRNTTQGGYWEERWLAELLQPTMPAVAGYDREIFVIYPDGNPVSGTRDIFYIISKSENTRIIGNISDSPYKIASFTTLTVFKTGNNVYQGIAYIEGETGNEKKLIYKRRVGIIPVLGPIEENISLIDIPSNNSKRLFIKNDTLHILYSKNNLIYNAILKDSLIEKNIFGLWKKSCWLFI